MLEKGLIQLYTGSGKGKTTAAFGLAIRAAGHGGKVLFYQFLKPADLMLGERVAMSKIDGINVKAIDQPWDMKKFLANDEDTAKMRQRISEALAEVETAAHEQYYDVIVLDEIVFCLEQGLADFAQVESIVKNRAPNVELVLTGAGADQKLIELADLVTEMKCLKHPFDNGLPARKGIEY